MNEDKINEYINTHPRECLYALFTILMLIWQTSAGFLGILFYVILIRKYKTSSLMIFVLGLFLLMSGIYFEQGTLSTVALGHFIKAGFQYNKLFWIDLIRSDYQAALIDIDDYILCLPLFIAGVLGLIDLIPKPAHADTIKALQSGLLPNQLQELPDRAITSLLDKAIENDSGTLLGVSKYTGSIITIPDHYVNQVVLVLGTTGAGKTITLRRFYQRAIKKRYPLIVIDGKPEEDNIKWLMKIAAQNNRPFYGFNCGDYQHYDPLTDV